MLEKKLGLKKGSSIIRQLLIRIGNSANIEIFEVKSTESANPLRLDDLGWNHISFYVDDMHESVISMEKAGGKALSEPHGNSRFEDSEGSESIYFKSPWGSLIELQSIPNGYYYPDYSETQAWLPEP